MKKSIDVILREVEENTFIQTFKEKKSCAEASKLAIGVLLFLLLIFPTWPFFYVPLFIGLSVSARGLVEMYHIQYQGKGTIFDLPYHRVWFVMLNLTILNIGLFVIKYYAK